MERPTALLFVFALATAAAAQSPPAVSAGTLEERIDRLFKRCTKPGVPGAVALVARGDEVLHRKAYGLADLERAVPLRPESVFDIASVSKQFTATCVLLLEQDGKVALDDSVRKHVSEMPECMEQITVRHLLLHTSGIPDYIGLLIAKKVDIEDRASPQEALDVLSNVDKLEFPTGSRWSYSNSNYFLLAEIVDRRCSSTMPEFATERVFRPLGMDATLVRSDTRALIANRALSFSPIARGQWVASYSNWEQVGDGAVHTTVDDLLRWARNFDTWTVGGDKLKAALSGPGALDDGEKIDYGFGLGFGTWRGHETVSHSGAWQGFRSDFLLVPKERLVVICLCNRTDLSATGLCKSMARIALDK